MLKDTDAAWLAGYIDGDGCICLMKKSKRKARSPELVIDSCDIELLDRVKSLIGGRISAKKSYNPRGRAGFHWRLNGSVQVVEVLRQLLPYMGCKDKIDRARILVDGWAACTPRNGCYTLDHLEAKDRLEREFLAIGYRRGFRTRLPEALPPSANLVALAQKLARGPRKRPALSSPPI